jgi:hypothetical protein
MQEFDYDAMIASDLNLTWSVPAEVARRYVITARAHLGAHWHRGDDIFEVTRAAAAELDHPSAELD